MKRLAVLAVLIGATGIVPAAVAPCAASAQTPGQRHAGLIIETPSGTQQFCVAFTAEEEAEGFDGIDLLQRSGVPVVLGGTRDVASVCRVGEHGCADPGDCFCECRDADADACRFWGYYTLDSQGRWTFAQQSASLRRVRDGDVDGWRFGSHGGGAGNPPRVPSERCAMPASSVRPGRTDGGGDGSGVPAGLIVGAVVALGFAIGIAYGVRRRPGQEDA